jgi:hypothetical protein
MILAVAAGTFALVAVPAAAASAEVFYDEGGCVVQQVTDGAPEGGSQCAGVDFGGTSMGQAAFMGANLAGANLSGSKLQAANFTGANIEGANFSARSRPRPPMRAGRPSSSLRWCRWASPQETA